MKSGIPISPVGSRQLGYNLLDKLLEIKYKKLQEVFFLKMKSVFDWIHHRIGKCYKKFTHYLDETNTLICLICMVSVLWVPFWLNKINSNASFVFCPEEFGSRSAFLDFDIFRCLCENLNDIYNFIWPLSSTKLLYNIRTLLVMHLNPLLINKASQHS